MKVDSFNDTKMNRITALQSEIDLIKADFKMIDDPGTIRLKHYHRRLYELYQEMQVVVQVLDRLAETINPALHSSD